VAPDLNRDGKPDLVVANSDSALDGGSGPSLSLFLGRGDGSFDPLPGITGLGENLLFLLSQDFNRDGIPDLAACSQLDPLVIGPLVYIFLGNGDGSFQRQPDLAVASKPAALIAADLNGDGKLDLATSSEQEQKISLLFGDGAGGFQRQDISDPSILAEATSQLAAADLNRDGVTDLLVTAPPNSISNSLRVLLGSGNGVFLPPIEILQTPDFGVFADLNRDGVLDLAGGREADGGQIVVFLGKK
jgi:hypothetical protein